MKKTIILLLLVISFCRIEAQLNGTAFLQSQTNHSGIRIKFISQGGTAVTDSAYTNSSGDYSININPGVYVISIAKQGYIEVLHNNGSTTLLTNTTVLSGVTLQPGTGVFVSGSVSGTWTPNNTYIVMGDLNIPSNNTLTILAGTKVQFNGFYSILGAGVIKALGINGNPVIFTSGMAIKARNDWKHIQLTSLGSSFNYCIFEYASFPINFQNSSTNLTNSILRHCVTLGAYIGAGTPLIENNEVYDIDGGSSAAIGIWVEGSATGTIQCNYIHDITTSGGNSYGIIHNSSLVKDNHITNITGPSPKGIQSRYSNSRNLNNCISNCGIGINIDGSWANSTVLIANNTFFSNQRGIEIDYAFKTLNPTIVNNLFTGNTYGVTQNGTATASSSISIDHNLFWNQSTSDFLNIPLAGIGQTVTTNSSGHPIDSYFNVYTDPLYNGNAPFLSVNSPCYNSGNTTYSAHIGFNNPIGCVGTVISVKELKNNTVNLNVHPNPTSGSFFLSKDFVGSRILNIFDIGGRKVLSMDVSPGQQINADYLENGVYMLTVKQGETTGKTLLIISK